MYVFICNASVYPQIRISAKHLLKIPVFMHRLGFGVLFFWSWIDKGL